ncbi:MAG: hypothetical protein M0004_15040 [Actinomycetota bacterium]|nr:hypothetical protein [Actinomycetota bacterium]
MATSTLAPRSSGRRDAPKRPIARTRASIGVLLAAGVVAAVALTFLYYAASVHLVAGNSDGATVVLEGKAMAQGNVALAGWRLSLDSFGSVDVPFYALGVLLLGVRPALLHLVPAALAVLVVATGAVLAAAGHRRLAAGAGAASVIAILALPGPDLGFYLLQGPWHVGTALYCLVAFGCVALRPTPWRAAAAAAVLAAGMLGDFLTAALGVLPVLAAGLVAARRERRLRAAVPPVLAAIGAVVLAACGRLLEEAVGTFTLVNRNLPLSTHQLTNNVGFVFRRFPALLGLGAIPADPASNGPSAAQWLHLPAVVLVVVAVLAAAARLVTRLVRPRPARAGATSFTLLEDCLLFGVLADGAVFVLGAASNNPEYTKYLTPGVAFAVVLGGRLVAQLAAGARARRRGALAVGLVASALALVAGFAYDAAADVDPATQPAAALGSFLLAHHLRLGIGDYWSSSLVTVQTKGQVVVRPVALGYAGKLRRDDRQSADDWYQNQRFQFFVCDLARPWHGVNVATAEATFGKPASTYAVGSYRVLVWDHRVAVSLKVPAFHSPLQLYFR